MVDSLKVMLYTETLTEVSEGLYERTRKNKACKVCKWFDRVAVSP